MPTVDNLQIELNAGASSATTALDKLIGQLDSLSSSVEKISNTDLKNFSSGLYSLTSAMQGMKDVKAPVFNKAAKGINKLADVDGAKLEKVAGTLPGLTSSVSALSGLQFDGKGINSMTKAITQLSNADLGNLSGADLGSIGAGLKDLASGLSGAEKVSKGTISMVNAIGRLGATGNVIGKVTAELPVLGASLKSTIATLSTADSVSDDILSFTQAIGNLANAGVKTGKTADGLENLADKTLSFFNVMKRAPQISENTIRMTEALAKLSAAGKGTAKYTANISSGFSKITAASRLAMQTVGRAASSIVNAIKKIGASSVHLNKVSIGLGSIFKSFVAYRGLLALKDFGKSAFEYGSAIAEVENVVDVAFGDMAQHAYDFAETATEQFGLSELAAKEYSGTMMAMLKSSGVLKSTAAEMSTTLAGLAGDLASFYNIDTDEAFRKIRSGISGEIEPLRNLGINLSVANLEAYALAKGIETSYNAMSQAEKVMLRYNYLLDVTGDQQGDFARTAGSYANQIRLLKLNFQSLAGVIGQGLIAAVLPAIKVLNALMAKLMQVAKAFRNFMYTLTGYQPQGSSGGVSNSFEGIGDSIEEMGDKAEAASKQLHTLGIDELNIISETSAASGGGGIDTGWMDGFEDITSGIANSKLPYAISEWARKIREAFLAEDWELLGKTIADMLNAGLQKVYDVINWNNVGPRIEKFIDAFTRTFNSFVEHFDWDLLGRTIGAGINTLVNTFNLLVEKLDFENLGRKISEGIRGLFNEVDWYALGNAIGNGFMILWRFLEGAVAGLNEKVNNMTGWALIGQSIGNAVNGIFDKIDFSTLAFVLVSGFNGIFDALREMTATIRFDDIANNISNGLNTLIHGIRWAEAGQILSDAVVNLLGVFQKVVNETDWYAFGKGIGDFLSNIDWATILGQVFDIIWEVLSGLISGLLDSENGKVILAIGAGLLAIKALFGEHTLIPIIASWVLGAGSELMKLPSLIMHKVAPGVDEGVTLIAGSSGKGGILSRLVTGAQNAFSGSGILSKIGTVIFSPKGLLIAGVIAGVAILIANWDKIADVAKDLWNNVLKPFGDWLSEVFSKIWSEVLSPAIEKLSKEILPPLINTLRKLWDEILVPLGELLYTVLSPEFKKLGDILMFLLDYAIIPVSQAIGDILIVAFETLGDVVNDTIDFFGGMIDFFVGVFTGDWDRVWAGCIDIFRGYFNVIPSIAEGVINLVIAGINGMIDSFNFIPELLGMSKIPNIPKVNLPRLEYGGIVTHHMIAEIGERNKREAVLPLENRRAMSMVAESIAENSSFAGNEQMANAMEEAAYRGMTRAYENSRQEDLLEELIQAVRDGRRIVIDGREIVTAYDSRKNRNGYSLST